MSTTPKAKRKKRTKSYRVVILAVIGIIFIMLVYNAFFYDDSGGTELSSTVVEVTATPAPTTVQTVLTPTPVPILNAASCVMQWKNDASRGINYMVPTHWQLTASGERYVVYSEPVPDGESGFRVAYVNKKKSSQPDSDKMRDELRSLVSEMESVYQDFSWDKTILRDDLMLVKFKPYYCTYTYTDDNGTPMKGFAIMATYDRRIYCMNYSGPADRYDDMETIMLKMVENMTRIS